MQGKFNLISLVMNFKIAFVSDNLFYVLQCTSPPHFNVPDLFQFCSLFAVYCSLT